MAISPGSPPVLPRSFLYVPGNRDGLFPKAAAGPADAVVLDLEDAVPLGEKETAREQVRHWLDEAPHDPGTPEWWVRINPDTIEEDLAAVDHARLSGVFLAKCDRAGLDRVAAARDQIYPTRVSQTLRVIGLVEDAAALTDLARVTAGPGLTTLGIGEVDLLADLRMRRSARTRPALDALRAHVVTHCAGAGLAAPVAPTSTAYRDLAAFEESTRDLFDLGFRSRTAIHPAQLPVIHDVLTPDAEEVAAARDVVARFEAAAGGVTTDAQGRMIDAAVVREAQETLARATGR